MAKSKTRVITKWRDQYIELKRRETNAISSCVTHKRLSERVQNIKEKIINAGGVLPEVN